MFVENSNSQEKSKRLKMLGFVTKKFLALAIIMGIVVLLPVTFFSLSKKAKVEVPINKIFYPNAPYLEGQLIVKLKDAYTKEELSSLKRTLEGVGIVSQKKVFDSEAPDLKDFYILTFKKGTDIKKVAEQLSKSPEIEAIAPNYISKSQVTPNDQFFPQQWDLEKIGMTQAWDINKGSNNVTVAVIDSGVDYTHEDFVGRTIMKGGDFVTCLRVEIKNGQAQCVTKQRDNDPMDDYGHGTHVAGTIGAVTNNNRGIAGVNWNVTLMAVKVMNAEGDGLSTDISDGIRYAVDNGADILNLSIAEPLPCSNSPNYKAAIRYAVDNNVVVVAAAGNEPIDAKDVTPASCDNVMTVASVDKNDKRAQTSGWGSKVSIAAPGIGIISLIPGNRYAPLSGTSMATPHVAGVAALLLSQKPLMSAVEVKSCLVNSALAITTDKPIGPRLNALGALSNCSNQAIPTATPIVTVAQNQPTPTQGAQPTDIPPNTATIKGRVFIDKNNNRQTDPGEVGYPGAQIVLEGKNRTVTTSSNGEYSFGVVSPGDYKVNLVISGQLIGYSPEFELTQGAEANIVFPLPSSFGPSGLTPAVTGTKSVTPTAKKTPSPTPQATYSCHMRTTTPKKESIQIGDLECTPN